MTVIGSKQAQQVGYRSSQVVRGDKGKLLQIAVFAGKRFDECGLPEFYLLSLSNLVADGKVKR